MLAGETTRRVPRQMPRIAAAVATAVGTFTALGVALGMSACSSAGVDWRDTQYVDHHAIANADTAGTTPAGACPGSLRLAHAGGDTYGAWWKIRPDSSSVLMAGRSTDGGRTWLVTDVADSTDHSRRGCARPAPAVAADLATHYFDIAYFLEPADGSGIFFTHTMDAPHLGTPNAVFHAAVPVMFGAHPSQAAVATAGDDVAVAYEDPNSEREMVGLALSRTMGHLFDARTVVSAPDLPAIHPRVALHGDSVTVEWVERPDSAASGGRIALRYGVWSR